MELKEGVGFMLEIWSFVLAGFLIDKNIIFSLLFFILGVALAIYVGDLIKKRGIKDARS